MNIIKQKFNQFFKKYIHCFTKDITISEPKIYNYFLTKNKIIFKQKKSHCLANNIINT